MATRPTPLQHLFANMVVSRVVVTLRFTRNVRFRFNHGGPLMGTLCRAMGTHALPDGVFPFSGESGRVFFEAGSEYNFGITCVGQPPSVVDKLVSGLRALGRTPIRSDLPPPVFGGNFDVVHVEGVPSPNFASVLKTGIGSGSVTLRFLSPMRMLRPRGMDQPREKYLNENCFPADHFLHRLWGRISNLATDCRETAERLRSECPPIPDDLAAVDPRLLWLDVPIKGKDRTAKHRKNGYTLGGVVGTIRLCGLSTEWLMVLAAGQYLHVGEKTHYGLGRYVICEDWEPERDPFRPAQTARQRLADRELLTEAVEYVATHSEAAGVDGVLPVTVRSEVPELADRLSSSLHKGTYQPQELLGILAEKKDGGLRALAIPTVEDRCVQRAAVQLLTPAVERLLEDCSYGYRKGFCRSHAAQAIQRAYDQGYRYVLDADIESFFDSVDWDRMLGKFTALFPYSGLDDLVQAWLAPPIRFSGRRIVRRRGLPQGSPISPLLANLFLDEFDEELLKRNYRLVRCADDFVVLCRDLQEAESAQRDVRALLQRLGLEVSPKKTSIASFDTGFTYLGYLFCRSLVLDQPKTAPTLHGDVTVHDIPANSWLAQVPLDRIRSVVHGRHSLEISPHVERIPLADLQTPPQERAVPLYLTGFDTHVDLRSPMLKMIDGDGHRSEISLRHLSHVVVLGKVDMSLPALLALARNNIPVYFCKRSGRLDVEFGEPAPDIGLWTAQQARGDSQDDCLSFARSIVRAKLHNQAAIMVRFKLHDRRNIALQIRDLERSCLDQQNLDQIRGLEGRGAALFFNSLVKTLAPEWGFEGRRRRPPPDPINALLSFGYTLIYNHLSTSLKSRGLHPRLGLYHQQKGTYHALACDLQEEFRHLVDAHVLAMVNRREVKVSDFEASSDGKYPCMMKSALFHKFVEGLERRLATEFRPTGCAEPTTYLEFMNRQALAVKKFIVDNDSGYEPLRIHA